MPPSGKKSFAVMGWGLWGRWRVWCSCRGELWQRKSLEHVPSREGTLAPKARYCWGVLAVLALHRSRSHTASLIVAFVFRFSAEPWGQMCVLFFSTCTFNLLSSTSAFLTRVVYVNTSTYLPPCLILFAQLFVFSQLMSLDLD